MLRPLIVVALVVAALLLPVLFRRQRRRAGLRAGALTPKFRRRLLVTMVLSVLMLVVGLVGIAGADNGDPNGSHDRDLEDRDQRDRGPREVPERDRRGQSAVIAHDHLAINFEWLMVGGVLVLFMQAGFALVETGFTRAKNAAHTMMMNLVIFALGVVGWFTVGYALMFGSVTNPGLGITSLGERRPHR